jgi:hypothetical protein
MRDLFADEALCVEAIAQALSDPHEVASQDGDKKSLEIYNS